MSDFNIREHCWEEFCIAEVHTKIARVNSTNYVELEFHQDTASLTFSREDSIALAKHFGHYKDKENEIHERTIENYKISNEALIEEIAILKNSAKQAEDYSRIKQLTELKDERGY